MKKIPISEYPHMMAYWHPTKNPQFDVHTTAAGTRKQAWWLCRKCGYEWQALISTRKESKGYCPRCDKDKQGPKTKTTIAMVPHLIDFWDFDANPDMDPYTLSAAKKRKANWKCPECKYKWSADINTRYYQKTDCPVCSGGIIMSGRNDVLSILPEIEYYYDSDFPGNPDLSKLGVSSKEIVHWRCPDCGRKWESKLTNHIQRRNGKLSVSACSHCIKSTGELSYLVKYPEAAEIYSSANKTPFRDLHAKNRTTDFLWICPECGFEFMSTLGSMLKLVKKPHKGCPVCLGKVIAPPGESVADLYPELLDEINDDTDLYKLFPNSRKEVPWKCAKCGYEWTTTIALRGMGYGKCAVCNNLRPVKGHNTVADLFYDIAKQWSPSNKINADELLPASSEWVKLICPDCGIEHSVQVRQATAGNIQCPYCNEKKVAPGRNSLEVTNPELVPLWSKQNARDISTIAFFMSYTAYWDCPDCGGTYPADINKMVSGEAYCKYCADEALLPGFNSLDKTNPELKDEWSSRNGLPMSQVKAFSWYRAYWVCPVCGGEHMATIKEHMEGTDSCKYCEGIVPIPGINSLKALHSEWMNEFDPENTVDPDTVFETYTLPLLWICKEGHHYPRSPLLRLWDESEGRDSCPFCDERTPTPGVNSLKVLHPEWMDEFDPENTVDPDTVFETYTQPLLWICKEGHHYPRSPLLRLQDEALGREPCPICGNRQIQPGVNSFAAKHKDLLAEWDYVSNYIIVDPDHVSDKSNIKVWFRCMKNPEHENYDMSIATRVLFKKRGNNPCPICKGRRRKKRHFV